MGGHAYIIPGELAPRLRPDLHPPPPPPPVSWWRQVLGGHARAAATASVMEMPNGDRFFDIPPGSLGAALIADLRAWIHTRLSTPSTGTAVVLDYLNDIEPTVYVRGLQQRAAPLPEFYVQITFSGCAGQAETSARVVSHWTAFWYAAEQRRIASAHLAPFGFTPSTPEPGEEEEMMFLPVGPYGYLEYNAPGPREPGESAFEIDAAAADAYQGDAALERLDAAFGRYMSEARCRCQICEPAFGDATPDA